MVAFGINGNHTFLFFKFLLSVPVFIWVHAEIVLKMHVFSVCHNLEAHAERMFVFVPIRSEQYEFAYL